MPIPPIPRPRPLSLSVAPSSPFPIGAYNPWADFAGNTLQDVGYGLATSPTIWTGLGAAAKRSADMQPYREERDTEARNRNATIESFRKAGRTDLLEYVQNGGDIGTAYGVYMKDITSAGNAEKDRATRERNAALFKNPEVAQAYIDGELDFNEAWKLQAGGGSNAATYGMQPVFLVDEQGNQVAAQMSSAGGILVNGEVLPGIPPGYRIVARPDNFSTVDMGGYRGVFDPNTGTYGSGPAIQGSPSQNMDVTMDATGARTMAPAQGSPEGVERTQARIAAQTHLTNLEQKNQTILGKIDQALARADMWTTGIIGQLANPIGGTPAYDLKQTLDTIKANLGFAELQAMRDASPTGGALGQVAVQELEMLQRTITSVEQAQSEAQLRQGLEMLRSVLTQTQAVRRQAFEAQYGSGGGTAAPNPSDPLGLGF